MRRFLCLILAFMLAASAGAESFLVQDDEDTVYDDGLIPAETPVPTGAAALGFTPLDWSAKSAVCKPHEDCYLPNNAGYHDDSIDVRVDKLYAENGTLVYAMTITLSDVSQFRTGTGANRAPYSQAVLVSTMSKRFHAVCAINDDFFGYHNEGIVYRNGKPYRIRPTKARDALIVDMNGDFHIITSPTNEKWEAYTGTVLHAFCFGPALVVDGKVNEAAKDTTLDLGKNKKTQRIAIGQIGHLQYLVLATDGPENVDNAGLTIAEMAELCEQQGMDNAYNLDGGSSSTMVLNHKKINGVGSKKRPVGGCIWFATLVP